jgi:hypothetical protein
LIYSNFISPVELSSADLSTKSSNFSTKTSSVFVFLGIRFMGAAVVGGVSPDDDFKRSDQQ